MNVGPTPSSQLPVRLSFGEGGETKTVSPRPVTRWRFPLLDERARFLLSGFCADRWLNFARCDRRNSANVFAQVAKLIPRDERRYHLLLCEVDLLVLKYRAAIQNVANGFLEREVLNPMQVASTIK